MLCILFIFLFVYKELNTDKFHSKRKEIYKILSFQEGHDQLKHATFMPLGQLLKDQLPEVKDFFRYSTPDLYDATIENKTFYKSPLSFVDPQFFELLDFKLVTGSIEEFRRNNNGIFISQKYIQKFFGNNDPLGRQISFVRPQDEDVMTFTIIGVIQDYPEESTFKPDLVANYGILDKKYEHMKWNIIFTELYLNIPKEFDARIVAQKTPKLIAHEISDQSQGWKYDENNKFDVVRLDRLYFETPTNGIYGDKNLLLIVLAIGVILLSVVGFNYVILNMGISTSQSHTLKTHRILGASKTQISSQFIIQALIHFFGALLISFSLQPFFSELFYKWFGYRYSLSFRHDILLILIFFLLITAVAVGIGAFLYFLFQKYQTKQSFTSKQLSYRLLLQFQFTVVLVLMISLMFMTRQINTIRDSDLGFDAQNTIVFQGINEDDVLFQELSKKSFITSIARGEPLYRSNMNLKKVQVGEREVGTNIFQGDHKYLNVYNIKLLAGRNLDPSKTVSSMSEFFDFKRKQDIVKELLVNEEFVKAAGIKEPLGQIIMEESFGTGEIVGVFQNVRNMPFYYPIKPMVMGYDFNYYHNSIIARASEGNIEILEAYLRNHYTESGLGAYFDLIARRYDFEMEYQKELEMTRMIKVFGAFIMVIFIIGLVAFSLFVMEKRTKEIGIRKVNGAKISEVLIMLNKDFVKWVFISLIIATPIAYYAMNQWLENFAYKTELSWWIFALAGVLALGIALLTVSWQSWKAATRNPVEALRYE